MKRITINGAYYYCCPCTAIAATDSGDENGRQAATLVICADGTELVADVCFGHEVPRSDAEFAAMCDVPAAWEPADEHTEVPELGGGPFSWQKYTW